MGFSSSSQQSSSESQGYGYNQSLAESIQNVCGPQSEALKPMYTAAGGLARNQAAALPGAMRGVMAPALAAGRQGLQQARQYAQPNSMLARRQTADLANVVGQEFGRTIMPQLRTNAGLAGGVGGSREAISRGIAAGDAAGAISRGATDFFSNAWNTGAQVATALPGMAGQVANLGMMPFQAQWAPWSSLAGILGGPTTLSRSRAASLGEQFSTSKSEGSGSSFGFNLW